MDEMLTVFQVDELYSSAEIQSALNVGNAGGVRLCLDKNGTVKRTIIMTSVPGARQVKENPYHDRMEGSILVYTGAGREGDQTLAGMNKRIPQQFVCGFPIYGFMIVGSRRDRSLGPKRWKFLGLLEYLRHYPETQVDIRGQLRKVWVFEFWAHRDPSRVSVQHDLVISTEMIEAAKEINRADLEDREVISVGPQEGANADGNDPKQIEEIRSRLLAMPPEKFEHLIKEVLVHTGFVQVAVTKYSQDGGIDVNAVSGNKMWPIQNLLVQVQAKRWLHTVGRKEVAELRGSLQPFARGTVVTTSHFSKAAINEAKEPGKNPIVLVDGYSFAALIRSINLELI